MHSTEEVYITYLHIFMPQVFYSPYPYLFIRISFKWHSVELFHLYVMFFKDSAQCWERDLMDIIENCVVIEYVCLNFSEAHHITLLASIYDSSLLFLWEYGAPSSILDPQSYVDM